VALVAATSGTAVAVTASKVSVADAKYPGRVAKVDTSGALKVTTLDTVNTRPLPPAQTFNVGGLVSNFYKNGSTYQVVLPATTASLAVTRMLYTNAITNANAWELFMYYETVPTGGTCQSFSAGHRVIEHVNLPPRESVSSVLPTPVVLEPTPGTDGWCIVAGGGPTQNTASSNDGGATEVRVSGYVVAGDLAEVSKPSKTGADPDRLGG
jgi:hypothetical protein